LVYRKNTNTQTSQDFDPKSMVMCGERDPEEKLLVLIRFKPFVHRTTRKEKKKKKKTQNTCAKCE